MVNGPVLIACLIGLCVSTVILVVQGNGGRTGDGQATKRHRGLAGPGGEDARDEAGAAC